MPSTAHRGVQSIALAAMFNALGEVLLLKRPLGTPQGSLWSFPGGKVESGETPLDAAQRELFEETGIAAHEWQLLGEGEYSYPNAHLHFYLFSCHCPDTAGLSCPEPHIWVPAPKLDEYPMPQANVELLNAMVSEYAVGLA